MSTTTSSVFSATNRSIANPTVGATSASLFASFADVSSRSALTSVVLPELARPMMSRRRCGCVGSCVACVCQSEDEGGKKRSGAFFSEDRALEGAGRDRGRRAPAPASTRTFFFARPSATSRLFHSPMRSWGWDEAQARARRARESGPSAFGRVAHASARRSISGARVAGKRRLSSRAFISSRRRLRCLRVTPRRNGRRSQGRQTPQTRGAWFETPRKRGVPRRAASIARSRVADVPADPSGRRTSVESARSTPSPKPSETTR